MKKININSQTKKMIITILLLILLVILVLNIFLNLNNKGRNKESDTQKFIEEYEKLNDKETEDGNIYPTVNIDDFNNIKYISLDESLDLIKNKTGVLFIGYPDCAYSRIVIQNLTEVASETNLDIIYYLDISKYWEELELDDNNNIVTTKEKTDNYDDFLKQLDEELIEKYILKDKDYNKIDTNKIKLKVPLVLFIVNGDIVSYKHKTVAEQFMPYLELNEVQKKDLKQIYYQGIKNVMESQNKEMKKIEEFE